MQCAVHAAVLQAEFEDICEEAQLWTKLQHLEQACQEQGLNEGEGLSGRYVNVYIFQIDCVQLTYQVTMHVMLLATCSCAFVFLCDTHYSKQAVCRLTGSMTPAEAAQSYRMQAKQEEKAELEAILEQVRLKQPF